MVQTSACQERLGKCGVECSSHCSCITLLYMDCFVYIAVAAALLFASKLSIQAATSLGPSQQSSPQCQQTFPCCTVCLVWLALGARKIPYGLPRLVSRSLTMKQTIKVLIFSHSIRNKIAKGLHWFTCYQTNLLIVSMCFLANTITC